MAKAQATRNGQPTPKLDKKIEKMKAMMGSTVQKVPAAKPSAGKFVDYKGVNKLPMQGGACTLRNVLETAFCFVAPQRYHAYKYHRNTARKETAR